VEPHAGSGEDIPMLPGKGESDLKGGGGIPLAIQGTYGVAGQNRPVVHLHPDQLPLAAGCFQGCPSEMNQTGPVAVQSPQR
jgi:hypothetical protein